MSEAEAQVTVGDQPTAEELKAVKRAAEVSRKRHHHPPSTGNVAFNILFLQDEVEVVKKLKTDKNGDHPHDDEENLVEEEDDLDEEEEDEEDGEEEGLDGEEEDEEEVDDDDLDEGEGDGTAASSTEIGPLVLTESHFLLADDVEAEEEEEDEDA